jgi:glycosyltransferase involved in cell wall biosynthesis
MRVSVIFPAYNEEANIEKTIARSLEALKGLCAKFEILIIDDASRDRTGLIADELSAEHPEVRVLHNQINMGQGASLVKGFQNATYDLVIHNAMDYPFDLRDLAKMLPLLDVADIVVAIRRRRPGYTLYRRMLSVVNIKLLQWLFGLRLRDYNFVQLYKKAVLTAIEVTARSPAFVTPQILIRAHDMGYRIKEIEIDYHPRLAGVATSGRLSVVKWSLRELLAFWLRRSWGRRRDPKKEAVQGVDVVSHPGSGFLDMPRHPARRRR